MKLDAFMMIEDAQVHDKFGTSLDKDNKDKVEILAFRQTVVRGADFSGAAKDGPPASVLITVLRMVDKNSENLLKRVKDDKFVKLSIFVRAMQMPDPEPAPPVPKYDKEYVKIVVEKAYVTRVRIALQSKPDNFGIYEEIEFTCKSGTIDWKTGKTKVDAFKIA